MSQSTSVNFPGTTFIEGVGDDVIFLFIAIICIIVVVLAWISTRVNFETTTITYHVFHLVNRSLRSSLADSQHSEPVETLNSHTSLLDEEPLSESQSQSIGESEYTTNNQSQPDISLLITIRIKYLNEELKTVSTCLQETIASFKQKHFAEEISTNKRVRLIFCGQELEDDENSRLVDYGFCDNDTVHVMISTQLVTDSQHTSTSNAANGHSRAQAGSMGTLWGHIDLSVLMFPSFGVLLVAAWYCRVLFRQYFNVMSTLSLVGISVFYLVSLLVCIAGNRRSPEEEPRQVRTVHYRLNAPSTSRQ